MDRYVERSFYKIEIQPGAAASRGYPSTGTPSPYVLMAVLIASVCVAAPCAKRLSLDGSIGREIVL